MIERASRSRVEDAHRVCTHGHSFVKVEYIGSYIHYKVLEQKSVNTNQREEDAKSSEICNSCVRKR